MILGIVNRIKFSLFLYLHIFVVKWGGEEEGANLTNPTLQSTAKGVSEKVAIFKVQKLSDTLCLDNLGRKILHLFSLSHFTLPTHVLSDISNCNQYTSCLYITLKDFNTSGNHLLWCSIVNWNEMSTLWTVVLNDTFLTSWIRLSRNRYHKFSKN